MIKAISLRPIGYVVKGIPKKSKNNKISKYKYESSIKIYNEYIAGLEGLNEYSHIIIVYYLHLAEFKRLKGRPWGRKDMPEVGIFATRAPHRPNSIGVTVCELLEVMPPYIRVRGLDAWDNTPIIDIKPYDYYDIVKNPRVPSWFIKYWSEKSKERNYRGIAPWLGP